MLLTPVVPDDGTIRWHAMCVHACHMTDSATLRNYRYLLAIVQFRAPFSLQIQGGDFASTLPAIPVQKKIARQLPTTLPTSVLWQLWQTPVCRQSV